MSPVLVVARATIREASRKKLVIALAVITVLGVILTGFGFWRLNIVAHEIAANGGRRLGPSAEKAVTSQLLILVMFAFSFVLAISTVFMAAPTIAGELESGVALAVLTRPVRRVELLAGKWLGLAAVAIGYTAVASALAFVAVHLATGYGPPHPLSFIAFLAGEALITLTLTTLISTRLSPVAGGVIALGGFMLAWMGGIAVALGSVLHIHSVSVVGSVTRLIVPTDGLWRGAIFNLEPVSVIAGFLGGGDRTQVAANPFFASAPPAWAYVGYAVFWGFAIFALATWSFSRREV
ncbi:MAG TPA: ABC transporter permease [Actinomycetota bacterium]|nr:ABC transporter permease [Actinomycetota bacterium]